MFVRTLLIIALGALVSAQDINDNGEDFAHLCPDMMPFCTDGVETYQAAWGVGAVYEEHINYGCLRTHPNPAWFYMKIKDPGTIEIEMRSDRGLDIDFAFWGPYTSVDAARADCDMGLRDPLSCSWDPDPVEHAISPFNAQTNEVYILLVTNYADDSNRIGFDQLGTATTDCSITHVCGDISLSLDSNTFSSCQGQTDIAQGSACDLSCANGFYSAGGMTGECVSDGSQGIWQIDGECRETFCLQNQFVSDYTCTSCADGTWADSGASAAGGNTECQAVICGVNENVMGHDCQACADGSWSDGGHDASAGDTTCIEIICGVNEKVMGHSCEDCAAGTTSEGGDSATGGDTGCQAIICGVNQQVHGHNCQDCAAGMESSGGHDASGGDTSCLAIICGVNERVQGHTCQPCGDGYQSAGGDDASMADTACELIQVEEDCTQVTEEAHSEINVNFAYTFRGLNAHLNM